MNDNDIDMIKMEDSAEEIDGIDDDPQLLYLFLHRHITNDESLDMNCCYMDDNSFYYIVRSPLCSIRVDIAGCGIHDSAIIFAASARDLNNNAKDVMREVFYVQAPYLRKSQLSFAFSLRCMISSVAGGKMSASGERLTRKSIIPDLGNLGKDLETACKLFNVRKALEDSPVYAEAGISNNLSAHIPLLTIRRSLDSQAFVRKLTEDAVKRSLGAVCIERDYITARISIVNAVNISEDSVINIYNCYLRKYEPSVLLKAYFTMPE